MIAFIDAHREVYGVEPICRVPPRRRGPWRRAGAVEFAALERAGWFNNRRLLERIGNIPPAAAEARYCAQTASQAMAA